MISFKHCLIIVNVMNKIINGFVKLVKVVFYFTEINPVGIKEIEKRIIVRMSVL